MIVTPAMGRRPRLSLGFGVCLVKLPLGGINLLTHAALAKGVEPGYGR